MPITIEHVRAVVDDYLQRYPQERDRLRRLLDGLAQEWALTSRKEFRGHLTCSVALLDDAERVLHIWHNTLGQWLPPGGHLESADPSLESAALRELREETGISADGLAPVNPGGGPIDIDIHPIPANAGKREPDHWHLDLCYAYRVPDQARHEFEALVQLQAEEVGAWGWRPTGSPRTLGLGRKLQLISEGSPGRPD